jgi:hypothetical protein
MIPARSIRAAPICTTMASSLAKPEIRAISTNRLASTAVRARLDSVPSRATVVIVVNP